MVVRIKRFFQIIRASTFYGLLEFVAPLTNSLLAKSVFVLLAAGKREHEKSRGERLRLAFEELGPLFVKFGQNLSTRPDLIPTDIVKELEKLQDQVPPFPWDQVNEILKESLPGPIEEYFIDIEQKAMASASIAQVHSAKLRDGKEVIIKVLRPRVLEVINKDLGLMHWIAKLVTKLWPDSVRLRLPELVSEFGKILHWELDLMREAANASQIRSNFEDSQDILYIPKVYWEMCSKNVMVMEKIQGIRVNDIQALEKKVST